MIRLKRGDTGIGIQATLYNDKGVVDLSESSVLFLFGSHSINSHIIDSDGTVQVVFNGKHTEKEGYFNAEFEVTFKDGRVETFPSNDYIKLNIIKDLGGKS